MIGRFTGVTLILIGLSLLAACGRSPQECCGSKEVIEHVVWQAGQLFPEQTIYSSNIEIPSDAVGASRKKGKQDDLKRKRVSKEEWMRELLSPMEDPIGDAVTSRRKEMQEDFKRRFSNRDERLRILRSREKLSTSELDAVADMCFTNQDKQRVCFMESSVTNIRVQAFDKQTGACECKADFVCTSVNLSWGTKHIEQMPLAYKSEATVEGRPYISRVRLGN